MVLNVSSASASKLKKPYIIVIMTTAQLNIMFSYVTMGTYLVKPMDGKVTSMSNRKKYVFLIIVCSRNDL